MIKKIITICASGFILFLTANAKADDGSGVFTFQNRYNGLIKEVSDLTGGTVITCGNFWGYKNKWGVYNRNIDTINDFQSVFENHYFLLNIETLQRVSKRAGLASCCIGDYLRTPIYLEFHTKYEGYKKYFLAKLVGTYNYETEAGEKIAVPYFKAEYFFYKLEFAYLNAYFTQNNKELR